MSTDISVSEQRNVFHFYNAHYTTKNKSQKDKGCVISHTGGLVGNQGKNGGYKGWGIPGQFGMRKG